jgi:hypothetical protein
MINSGEWGLLCLFLLRATRWRMVSGRTKAHELERLLPWHWQAERLAATADT